MTFKLEAAYHEAGHSLIAYLSAYHRQIGHVELKEYGAGEAQVSLSKSKLTHAGFEASADAATKPEVAKDLAMILVAGHIAEQVAAGNNVPISPDPSCSRPDHDLASQVLSNAGLSRKFDRLEAVVRELLEENWPILSSLAQWLWAEGVANSAEIEEFISVRIDE